MSIVSVDTDYNRLTVVVVAEFDAPIAQVWELWADPRKAERWWGPPGYPATFGQHDLVAGGVVQYVMNGPDGGTYGGLWHVTAVDPPVSLEFDALFADEDGQPATEMPISRVSVRLSERGGGTRMRMRSTFVSRDDLQAWLDTGTREGQQQAIAQMDVLLATTDRDRPPDRP